MQEKRTMREDIKNKGKYKGCLNSSLYIGSYTK